MFIRILLLIKCYFSYMPDAKSRALDNLGRVHARIGNFQKAIDVYVFSFSICSQIRLLSAEKHICFTRLCCYVVHLETFFCQILFLHLLRPRAQPALKS